jgi:formylglycine-generating enzyme required for sulfatase activity
LHRVLTAAEGLKPRRLLVSGQAVTRKQDSSQHSAPQILINRKDGAVMIYITRGPFPMGDDDTEFIKSKNPRHMVSLSGYYIYKNLVTVAMYVKFCQVTGRQMPPKPAWGGQEDHPIVNVTWDDASAYCKWAGVALPTEAQWEKAARGTDGRKFPWGDTFDASKLQCSKWSMSDAKGTAPVGSFPSGASPYGVLDMAGNVWQWCSDWYDEDYCKSDHGSDPAGPDSGSFRLVRGGSWDYEDADLFRSAFRNRFGPAVRYNDVGFRAVAPGLR